MVYVYVLHAPLWNVVWCAISWCDIYGKWLGEGSRLAMHVKEWTLITSLDVDETCKQEVRKQVMTRGLQSKSTSNFCLFRWRQGKSFYHRIRPEGVRGSLHSAAAAGNDTDIQRLIAGGASVNRSTLGGVAPLHMAAHNGHTESISRLLAARAEVNQLAPGGTTALLLGSFLAVLHIVLCIWNTPQLQCIKSHRFNSILFCPSWLQLQYLRSVARSSKILLGCMAGTLLLKDNMQMQ